MLNGASLLRLPSKSFNVSSSAPRFNKVKSVHMWGFNGQFRSHGGSTVTDRYRKLNKRFTLGKEREIFLKGTKFETIRVTKYTVYRKPGAIPFVSNEIRFLFHLYFCIFALTVHSSMAVPAHNSKTNPSFFKNISTVTSIIHLCVAEGAVKGEHYCIETEIFIELLLADCTHFKLQGNDVGCLLQ